MVRAARSMPQREEVVLLFFIRCPIVGRRLARVVPRSFGASIQVVSPRGRAVLAGLLGEQATCAEEAHAEHSIIRGLLILKEPLDKILAGTKTWEIRGKATARRGYHAH